MKDVFVGDVTIIKAHENNPQDPCDWYFYLLIHHKYQPRMLIPYVDPMGKLSVIRCLFPSFQQKKNVAWSTSLWCISYQSSGSVQERYNTPWYRTPKSAIPCSPTMKKKSLYGPVGKGCSGCVPLKVCWNNHQRVKGALPPFRLAGVTPRGHRSDVAQSLAKTPRVLHCSLVHQEFFLYLKWRNPEPYIGEDSSILGTWNVGWLVLGVFDGSDSRRFGEKTLGNNKRPVQPCEANGTRWASTGMSCNGT